MSNPLVAANSPAQVDLKAGDKYAFCVCGRSRNQPFCDGSHKGTGLAPLVFTAESDGPAWLCRCKQTGSAPFCDGTHQGVRDDQVGGEL